MAKDLFYDIVREVLLGDGWTITHDPYELRTYDPEWEIDFAAEKILAANRGPDKIAVEVKSFLETSFAYEFHSVLGQYLNYRSGMKRVDAERILYLAVPIEIFELEFSRTGIVNAVNDYQVNILVYDPINKEIIQWRT